MKKCEVEGCGKESICRFKGVGKRLCSRHWRHMSRWGEIRFFQKKDLNEYVDCKTHVEIILRNTQCKEVARALIDAEDKKLVCMMKWYSKRGYPASNVLKNGIRTTLRIHSLLLPCEAGYEVDHIDLNPLNNRKSNLRKVRHQENMFNRKDAKGYSWSRQNKKWVAYLTKDYKRIYLGSFSTKQEAADARLAAEIKYFGEYRCKQKEVE